MPASGGEYAYPSGFWLVYPDGWTAVPGAQLGGARDNLPRDLKDWIGEYSIHLVLIHDGDSGFRET
jgi:hypothetical protein